jgi:hypothetical protein
MAKQGMSLRNAEAYCVTQKILVSGRGQAKKTRQRRVF